MRMSELTAAPRVRIRFITVKSPISAAIRCITNSLFSHVEFGTPEGTWIGAHDSGGIQERPPNYCNPVREYYYALRCTPEQMAAHLARIRAKIGTRYNFADILGLLLRRRGLTTPGREMCAQFCTEELVTMFPTQVLNVRAGYFHLVTPEMLHLSPIFIGRLVWRVG